MADDKKNVPANQGISPLAAGAIGAAVGLAAGAIAVELTDDEKRNAAEKAVVDKVDDFRAKGEQVVDNLKKAA